MADPKTLKEAVAAYGAVAADLEQPLVLERDGRPFAVLLSFEAYQRLCERAAKEEQGISWRERFKQLLAEVHARTAVHPPEEIEAEITAASNEVRELRYGHHSGR
jgi:PHD/YefM family antitoxin component YafN of YafNO toxin-antitoxin module